MNKFAFKLISLQIFILFIAVFKLINPGLAQASELIGTHLGEGDVVFQKNIINSVLIPNGLGAGSPVTVMVPVTNLQPGQINIVLDLAKAVNDGGFFPIVRINRVCMNFERETGLNPVETVNLAKEIFGNDAIIVWGNEINNQDDDIKGCKNWQKYYDDFSTIKDIPNVSPAALDYYMGTEAYTVKTMFDSVSGMADLFNKAPRVANAYGCTDEKNNVSCNPIPESQVCAKQGNCDPNPTNTQQIGYNEISGPIYLTEFSLSPNSNSPDAPDTNIPKVLEFIKHYGEKISEIGGIKVTPLVRNVCGGPSDWLLYINGKLFTPSGIEVTENCEGGLASGGYDNSRYPEYGVDESKSYISPIIRVIDSPSDPLVKNNIADLRSELINQGYEAYCATENVSISPKYDSAGIIDRYFELNPEGIKNLEVNAVEKLDTTNTQYPLWRDVSNRQFLMTSLEEYFGFKDIYQDTPSQSVLNSSPINSLLSKPQMCVQGWLNLVAQSLACQRLARPEECELSTRPIPGTGFTVGSLTAELKKYRPDYQDGVAKSGCTALINDPKHNVYNDPKNANRENLLAGLINTPTYFDRAYRYGFIVSVVHTKNVAKTTNGLNTKIFNFFTQSTATEHPKDEVLVAAFKLPDIGTNKGGGDENGGISWSDPLDLTRKLLTTKQEQKYHEEISRVVGETSDGKQQFAGTSRQEFRKKLLLDADKVGKRAQTAKDKIYCTDAIEENGLFTAEVLGHANFSPSCKNYLTKAITDIINANASGCGDTEAVNIIKDLAGLGNPGNKDGREFNEDSGGLVLRNLFANDITHRTMLFKDPQHAENDSKQGGAENLIYKSFFNLTKDEWDNKDDGGVTADFYIVYPMGFELKAVENAIKGVFFTKAQLVKLEKQKQQTPDGFNLSGTGISLDSGSDGFTFEDEPKTLAGECGTEQISVPSTILEFDPLDGNVPVSPTSPGLDQEVLITVNKRCMENPSISIEQDPVGVGILGAKLGFWMKQTQKQLNTRTSTAWSYFNSCTTTEEFMLGRCRGGSLSVGNTNNNQGSNPSGKETYCVDWIGLSPEKASIYKDNMRKHLQSFEHFDGKQKPKFITELSKQTHIDWRGNTISPARTNFYEVWYGGGRALLWTKHPDCNGKVCFDHIMDTCAARGVNPAICVGMTITETGGLNHMRFPKSYDFGCLASAPANIDSGLNCLMNKFFFSKTPRDGKLIEEMNYSEMWQQFAGLNFESSSYTTMQNFLKDAGDVGYSEGACK